MPLNAIIFIIIYSSFATSGVTLCNMLCDMWFKRTAQLLVLTQLKLHLFGRFLRCLKPLMMKRRGGGGGEGVEEPRATGAYF